MFQTIYILGGSGSRNVEENISPQIKNENKMPNLPNIISLQFLQMKNLDNRA